MDWVLKPGESWTQYLGMQDAWRTFFNDNGVHRSHYVRGKKPFEESRRGANKPTYHDFTPITDRTVQLRLAHLGHEGYTEKGRNPDAVHSRLDDKFEEVNVTIDPNSRLFNPPLPNPLPKPRKKNGRREPSKAYVQRMMGNKKMNNEFPDSSQRYAVALRLVEEHYGKATRERIAPRNNPRMPLDGMEDDKKVKKAKNAYKKFHGGKDPKNVTKEKVDIGEVWYALGPCWSIGYMSPKETGDENQKYIHHVNEDSKDGNFPMMYATMPEGGEPMIVIKGGSMRIGMRDGMAWLID